MNAEHRDAAGSLFSAECLSGAESARRAELLWNVCRVGSREHLEQNGLLRDEYEELFE